jgi:uncharacterized protein YodC (DUF2158 family)
MDENVKGRVSSFVNSVGRLFTDIESWIASTTLKAIRQPIQISEEASGRYEIDKLTLKSEKGKRVAEFFPVGAFIIGGNGRIDLVGTIDKAIIVNLKTGGPVMTTTIAAEGYKETRTTSFYEGVTQEGWYLIGDGRHGKAYFFTKDLFFDLLREVSDYAGG